MTTLLDRILRRPTGQHEAAIDTADQTTDGSTVLMQFLTCGGATVQVDEDWVTTYWNKNNPTGQEPRYLHRCLGCGQSGSSSYLDSARSNANNHAAECRAMPKPAA